MATSASGIQRQLTPQESLRVMGYPDTVLGGRAMQTLTPAEIRNMIGSAFDYAHLWFILRELRHPDKGRDTHPVACPIVWEYATQEKFEMFMLQMDGPTRRDHFRQMQEDANYIMLECHLKLINLDGPRKTAKCFPVPPGMRASGNHCLEIMRLGGQIIRNVPPSNLWFKVRAFTKTKRESFIPTPTLPYRKFVL